jgi:hypothetical protein
MQKTAPTCAKIAHNKTNYTKLNMTKGGVVSHKTFESVNYIMILHNFIILFRWEFALLYRFKEPLRHQIVQLLFFLFAFFLSSKALYYSENSITESVSN